jgi:predicted DNA-binding transcriptional regulator AlpA
MQTFLPHENYGVSARCLDDKRLGKQRVEAWQIVKALRGDYNDTGAWVNHPATRMWAGHINELCNYGAVMCTEWVKRGFQDSLYDQFTNAIDGTDATPWWVNSELLHLTHRSNLIRKDSDYYTFDVPYNIPYVWPLMDEQAFRLGTFKKGDNLDMIGNNLVYLTSKQVAELLGVSPKTISSYKARGQMPKPDREYGRTPLWKYSTIQEWRKDLRTPIKTEN